MPHAMQLLLNIVVTIVDSRMGRGLVNLGDREFESPTYR